jgi:acyl carrier protein
MLDPPLRTATGKVRRRALGDAISQTIPMEPRDILPELRALIADVTKRDASKLGADDDLVAALLLDSLEALRLLAFVEKRFGVRFDDDEVHGIRTPAQLAAAVRRRRS